jgi:general secretion pathway protein F
MPVFEYVALDARGKRTKGSIDAENPRAARQRLRSQGVFPTELNENAAVVRTGSTDLSKYLVSTRVGLKELAVTTRQLATLVGAGLPLVNALQALSEQCESKIMQRILVDVREQVEQGSSLATALGKSPKVFPRLYINMVASGEASGTLETVMINLADYLESQVELRRKVFSALTYPIIMLTVCVLVISALLVFVVPRIVEIFQRQKIELPLPTKIVIAASDTLIAYWPVMIGLVALLLWSVKLYYEKPKGRSQADRILLQLPVFRTLYVKVMTARVAQTLSALLSSGVGLLQALDIVKNIVGNTHVVKALEDARDGVREGRSLARELGRSRIFPSMLGHMVAVGEKSGELESMLKKAGTAYDSEVKSALAALTSLIEPLMMIVVGAIVLLIVISVLLPMVSLIDQIQT